MEERKEVIKLRLFAFGVILVYALGTYIVYKVILI